jgi:hypothetical protein
MRGIRRALALSAVFTLLPSLSFADDPYADYRIPEHYWRSWTANLLGSGSRSVNQSIFGEPGISGQFSGSGMTSLIGGYDSDTRSDLYSMSLAAFGNRQHSTVHSEFPPFSADRDNGDQSASEILSGFYGLSRYPWAAPLGYSVSANGSANLDQQWSSSSQVQTSPPAEFHSTSNNTNGSATGSVALTGSVSWGRVRDATPVYQVQILEQRLLELGTITRPLSPHARERLAALYTVEFDVSFAHQRPTKYFWGELERLLTEDGALGPGGLDAYAVQRLLEPLAVSARGVVSRTRGFAIGPQVMLGKTWTHDSGEAAYRDAVVVDDTLFSSSELIVPRTRTDQHDETIFSGAFVEYHRPLGMHWQVDGVSQGLLSEAGENLIANTTVRATWQVADRWFITAGFLHNLIAPGHGLERRPQRWSVTGDASVNYFFEDAWAFQLGYTQRQDRYDSDLYTRQDTFQLGVTWQFSGRLTAPGLFEPMRLSPPSN